MDHHAETFTALLTCKVSLTHLVDYLNHYSVKEMQFVDGFRLIWKNSSGNFNLEDRLNIPGI